MAFCGLESQIRDPKSKIVQCRLRLKRNIAWRKGGGPLLRNACVNWEYRRARSSLKRILSIAEAESIWGSCALRLRRVGARAILTFKQRLPTKSSIKHQQEEETEVANAEAAHAILTALGFRPALVYEKRRTRWQLGRAEIVIDELPFGLFMEIEATEKEIARVEALLGIEDLPAVMETYPTLTARLGKERKGIVEARFRKGRVRSPTVREG